MFAAAAVAVVVMLRRIEKRMIQLVGQQDTLNRTLGSKMWQQLIEQLTAETFVDEG